MGMIWQVFGSEHGKTFGSEMGTGIVELLILWYVGVSLLELE